MSHDLATLVGSRICHDLISPIGAIGNGVELLSMSGGTGTDEMDLISGSVEQASARIRFFRIAFGAADPNQKIAGSDIALILGNLAAAGRIAYDWTIADPMPRDLARIALLAAQCVETALPAGGRVIVTSDDNALKIAGIADKISVDPTLWQLLEGANTSHVHSAAQVQFALLPRAIDEAVMNLSVAQTDRTITIQVAKTT